MNAAASSSKAGTILLGSRRRLIALGLAVFVAGLVARFPANAAIAWFMPDVPGISLGNANGTVWSGHLAGSEYRKLSIPRIEWELSPAALLTGRLTAQLTVHLPQGKINADVSRSVGGHTIISDLQGNASLALASHIGLMPDNFASGELLLNFSHIELENGKPTAIEGRGALTRLRNNLLPGIPLGDYEATIETADTNIVGNFRDMQAPVEITGTATLMPDGRYTVSATLRSRAEAPDELKEGLKLLGPEDAEGRRRLDIEGRL